MFVLSNGVDYVHGQGFQVMNDRNHPHLQWKEADSENIRIIYPSHLEAIIPEAITIAEESYRALKKNFGIGFEERIRIYLTDSDEISNGFVAPVGDGHTNIWVNLNEYAEIWTGTQKWLWKVVPHELAHLFHFKAIQTRAGLLNFALARPINMAWTEGIAQYMTEEWDSERGDRWLRLAIFDNRPDFRDRSWLYNRRLMYAVGHSQVRYFAETHGDSTLVEMFSHRDTLAGVVDLHDFERSFRAVTGQSYQEFEDEWLRHMNIYYNTLASQMERTDSLAVDPESLPGRYFFDVKQSPDRSEIAVLSIPTMQRAQRRLYLVQNDSTRSRRIVADGDIRRGLDWSPDGQKLVYSRRVRGNHGALIHDLYLLDTDSESETRLTQHRRAFYPVFSADGQSVAFIANNGGTANLFLLNLESGEEVQLTGYYGDVQLITLAWNHHRNEFIYQKFDANGRRHLVRFDPDSRQERILDSHEGHIDNRWPLVSPDGEMIAYTSLRDRVPNLFVHELDSGREWRVTHLFTGGEGFDWVASEDDDPGTLLVRSTESKRSESMFSIPADRQANGSEPVLPEPYDFWSQRTPPEVIDSRVETDASLIEAQRSYNSWANITHGVSLATPYYAGWGRYGVAGFTSWIEPLGKHTIAGGGALALNHLSSSEGFLVYQNRQLEPSIIASLFRMPMRVYDVREMMLERRTGGELLVRWPINRFETTWRSSWMGLRVRYYGAEPYRIGGRDLVSLTPDPVSGTQFSLRGSWAISKATPFYRDKIHPLDGYGFQISLAGAEPWLGSDVSMTSLETHGYLILPGLGLNRFYIYGRLQLQGGDPLPQDHIGFSRGDKISIDAPLEFGFLRTYLNERVRGYRSFISGRQVAFLSAEYRMPFLHSLRTNLLGLVQLGTTSLTLFADAGHVSRVTFADSNQPARSRLGVGTELKNMVRVGPMTFLHAVGVAQPYDELFERDVDLYYRVQATVPF